MASSVAIAIAMGNTNSLPAELAARSTIMISSVA